MPSVVFSGNIATVTNYDRTFQVNTSGFTGTDEERDNALIAALNALFQKRVAKTDLPSDATDRITDPASKYGERMYWDGNDVVSRELIAERYQNPETGQFHVRIRVAV